jgi:hypothetical protein
LPDSIIIAHGRIAGWAMTILTTGASAKPAFRLLGWVGADENEEPASRMLARGRCRGRNTFCPKRSARIT